MEALYTRLLQRLSEDYSPKMSTGLSQSVGRALTEIRLTKASTGPIVDTSTMWGI